MLDEDELVEAGTAVSNVTEVLASDMAPTDKIEVWRVLEIEDMNLVDVMLVRTQRLVMRKDWILGRCSALRG